MSRLPDFIIIGAMKCATSTLHEQLARQPGVFMCDPKEPCFFSDDAQWRRGVDWYKNLFAQAKPGDICGESSTHYTKRPTHPGTIDRMRQCCGDALRFIYMMRHPIDRLVSQYIHEWSQGVIGGNISIDEAVELHPQWIDYGRYAYQLKPYVDAFEGGADRIMLIFFERFVAEPQHELKRVGEFLGLPELTWIEDVAQRNVSSERVRRSPLRDAVLKTPGIRPILRTILPQAVRNRVKVKWSMQQRPELSPSVRARLEDTYDQDLRELGSMMGAHLSCANFRQMALIINPNLAKQPAAAAR